MHELGLCDALLKKVQKIAAENELEGVNSISLDIGSLSGVMPHYMLDCWEAVVDGTAFEQTKLLVRSVAGEAECMDCGSVFEADLNRLVCPKCKGEKLRPISGQDMTITEIEGY